MPNAESVFDWKALPTWSDWIAEIIPTAHRADLVAHIAEFADTFTYRDDAYHFEKIYREFGGFEALLDRFADHFPSRYPFARMYHGCRCVDPASYYEKGMLVLDAAVAAQSFARLYLNNPSFPGITDADISAAVESMAGAPQRDGFIYFGLDDRFLAKFCKHYLTHGSEYLQALAVRLEERCGHDIKSDLARRGTPTVFCVRFPADCIAPGILRELGQNAFYAWAFGIARHTTETWEIDFGVETDRSLSPEHIIEHYSPIGL